MATYHPDTFRWAPPTLETRLSDEPDINEIQVRLLYDHTQGRLGSDIRLRLRGSEDDTRSTCLVRTRVEIRIAQPIPSGAVGVHVVAKFRCEESSREFDHYDESGDSNLIVDYRSKPFARLDLDPPLGRYAYDEPFFEWYSQHADKSFLIGGLDFDHGDAGPMKPGDLGTFDVGLDEVAPTRGMLIEVGMEDEVVAQSDDTTYIVRLRSHWFLERVDLTPY